MNNIAFAFMLTLIAGLATGIGSLAAFFPKSGSSKFLSLSLGFSAGVMIYVAMIEIFMKAQEALTIEYGEKNGSLVTIAAFFTGMLLTGIIESIVHGEHDSHETAPAMPIKNETSIKTDRVKLIRMGLFTALAISAHNFLEGLATFVTALREPSLAVPIALAVAIHNIPVGIAVSVPIFQATGDRKKAFFISFASGLFEPVGALIGYLILVPFISDAVYGFLFAAVAGIMVYISVDELLPSAMSYGERHLSVYGFAAGMALIGLSLWMFL